MMTELDTVIATAYQNPGEVSAANKVYQVFLRTTLYMPIAKRPEADTKKSVLEDAPLDTATETDEELYRPLISQYDNKYFIIAFDDYDRLVQWAGNELDNIGYAQISGRDLVRCVGPQLFLCLNVGCEYYKEFHPEEILRLKKVVSKTLPPSQRDL